MERVRRRRSTTRGWLKNFSIRPCFNVFIPETNHCTYSTSHLAPTLEFVNWAHITPNKNCEVDFSTWPNLAFKCKRFFDLSYHTLAFQHVVWALSHEMYLFRHLCTGLVHKIVMKGGTIVTPWTVAPRVPIFETEWPLTSVLIFGSHPLADDPILPSRNVAMMLVYRFKIYLRRHTCASRDKVGSFKITVCA